MDYGNEDMIPFTKVRIPLRDELFKLPFQVGRERGGGIGCYDTVAMVALFFFFCLQALQCRLHGTPASKVGGARGHHLVQDGLTLVNV